MGLLHLIKNKKGQSLVEILLAMGLMAVFLPALLTGFVASREAKPQKQKRFAATVLLREAEEAVRSARESDWKNIATAGTYYPVVSANEWALTSGSETTTEGFTREIIITDVERDINGDIIETGGIVDPSTKQIDITVSWQTPIPGAVDTTTLLTRWKNNTTWKQDTQTEFDNGIFTTTVSTLNSNGEVELEEASGGSWTSPTEIEFFDDSGTGDGQAIFVEGNYAYLGTTHGGGDSDFTIIDVSDPTSVIEVGTLEAGGTIYDIEVSGNYAYAATGENTKEFMIIDISDETNPTIVGSVDAPGNNDAFSIAINGNYAYIGRDQGKGNVRELIVVNITSPTSPNAVGNLELNTDINELSAVGNYLYAATDSNSEEMMVIDISTPASPSKVAAVDTPSGSNGEGIDTIGNYAYLTTSNNGPGNELYLINISSPTSPTIVSSFNIGNSAFGVFAVTNYAFVVTNINTAELMIMDFSTPTSPTTLGFIDLGGSGGSALDVFVSGDYAFLATTSTTQELVVVQGGFGGGGGGGNYVTTGTYESQSFNAGAEVAFNYLTFSLTEPSNTNINFQIATNNDNATWGFVGPDGTNGTYFEGSSAIPLNSVLGQYLKFKAYFISDGVETPILEDVTVNYSP